MHVAAEAVRVEISPSLRLWPVRAAIGGRRLGYRKTYHGRSPEVMECEVADAGSIRELAPTTT